jgi:LysM repeat protein
VLKIADLLPARKVLATWSLAACLLVLAAGLTSCTYSEPSSAVGSAAVPASPASTADSESPLGGEIHADSFANVDFYTTVSGDTLANDAGMYKLSEGKVAEFNGLQPGAPLTPGTKLRLVPEGPILGAKGAVTTDANGIPTSYVIESEDTLGGITYRFNLTHEQLAEANKVPFTYEKGGAYFNQAGDTIKLQKNPVDIRAGKGDTVTNSFGQAVFYTTVDGDSFDSLGYQFRSTTEQILRYNPSLAANKPIPAGRKLRLIPGELNIQDAQGTFTAAAEGIPLTYTTATGDTERQISFRFGITDLRAANRHRRARAEPGTKLLTCRPAN